MKSSLDRRRASGAVIHVMLVGMAMSGCVSSLNRLKPYQDYRGTTLMLEENARLVVNEGWTGGNLTMLIIGPKKFNELLSNSDPLLQDSEYGLWAYIPLPPGTPLRLSKFLYRKTGAGSFIEGHGQVYVEEQGRFVPFVYNWAERCDRYLKRAPWEPADIPVQQRPLARTGCPPLP